MKVIIFTPLLINYVKPHSWLECVDYQIQEDTDLDYYNKDQCIGFPRGFESQYESGFGVDTGFDHRDGSTCQSQNKNTYSDNIMQSVYVAGQRVCLAYPAKNHVADVCTNEFIPDTQTIIQRSKIQNSDDFTDSIFYDNLNGIHEKGVIDYKGYQNCPKFCEDPDKSLCTMCFDLPENEISGSYTFRWTWEFNQNEFYYTCWDAEIIGLDNDAQPTQVPTQVPVTTESPGINTPEPTPCNTPEPTTPSPTPCLKPVTPEPTEHMEECPGFLGTFVTSLDHCPPPTPEPTMGDTPSPTTPEPTMGDTPEPTMGDIVGPITPEPTMGDTPSPTTPEPTMGDTPSPTTPEPTMGDTPKPTTPSPTPCLKPVTPEPTMDDIVGPVTPEPTEHMEECPGFVGTFVNSLDHCPSPIPGLTPSPTTPEPTMGDTPSPTTPEPTMGDTPSPTTPEPTMGSTPPPPCIHQKTPTPTTPCPELPMPMIPIEPTPEPTTTITGCLGVYNNLSEEEKKYILKIIFNHND